MSRGQWPGLVLFALIAATGCAHTSGAAPKEKLPSASLDPYFPLAEGNTWHYQGTMLGQPVSRTVTIVGRDGLWFIDSEGERYQFDGDGLRSPARYLLKGPVAEGTSWNSVVSVSSTERYEVESVGVTVGTAAGRFEKCVVVLSQNRQDAATLLFKRDVFCPGVGLVRIETWAEIEGKGKMPAASLELARFEIQPAASPAAP